MEVGLVIMDENPADALRVARAPLALAAAASDVQGIAGGRFVLGVGSSTRRMN